MSDTQSTSPSPPSKKRGGQSGNLNALKHGFYSRQFNPSERSDLDAAQFTGLTDEIALFRVQIRRAVELGRQAQTFEQGVIFLRAIAHAFTSLSRLMRTQHYLTLGSGSWNAEFDKALDDILREMQEEEENSHPSSQNPSAPSPQ